MTHSCTDTIIWSLLEGTSRQRVGECIYCPKVPVSKRWVARPNRADITHKRAPGQEPLLILPHVFMKEVGRIWEPRGNCAAKGDFWPWECLDRSGENPELGH